MRFLLLVAALLFALPAYAQHSERWVVYYTDKLAADAFSDFDLIVFDSDHHPPLAPIQAQGKTVLGYISLGEAEKYRDYFNTIKRKDVLLKSNPHWKGHVVIDVRKSAWKNMVLDELIPAILNQGFDGIMIDTIDSVIQPEIDDPKHYIGMQDAAVDLIRSIRIRYPSIKIMLNRGFEILPQIATDIDMVMAESTLGDWQPEAKKARLLSEQEYMGYVNLLKDAQRMAPGLKVYTIDYWPAKDRKGIKHLYATQRAQGFVPYVGPLDLQSVWSEPK
jgi:polysaccharide biosynthesis protein PelA